MTDTLAPGALAGPQTICLSMIVRNERHVIDRCLDSIAPFITHWAVVDTGSTDGTQDRIRERLASIPGKLIEREWPDRFDVARNWALDLALETDAGWLMFFDADDELEWTVRRGPLSALDPEVGISLAAYEHSDEIAICDRLFLVHRSRRVEWIGAVHECPFPRRKMRHLIPSQLRCRVHRDGAASRDGQKAKLRGYLRILRRVTSEDGATPFDFFHLARAEWHDGDRATARDAARTALDSPQPWPDEWRAALEEWAEPVETVAALRRVSSATQERPQRDQQGT